MFWVCLGRYLDTVPHFPHCLHTVCRIEIQEPGVLLAINAFMQNSYCKKSVLTDFCSDTILSQIWQQCLTFPVVVLTPFQQGRQLKFHGKPELWNKMPEAHQCGWLPTSHRSQCWIIYHKHEVFASGGQQDEPFIMSLSLHEFTLSYGENSQNL